MSLLSNLSDDDARGLLYDWRFWARPAQLAPEGDWRAWVINAGRGFGKTRSGAEWVRDQVERHGRRRMALVGRTAADVRDVMVEGPSGILAVCPPWARPKYFPSKRRLVWPSGAIATTYAAEKPDQLRGPQHDAAWGDEVAAWRYDDAYDQLMFGLRQGNNPQAVFTTTPRPTKLVKALISGPDTIVVTGSTYDNAANLAPQFIDRIIQRYEGTRLGRQEIYAAILDDNPGALWNRALLEKHRVRKMPELTRIVVAIDPSASSKDGAAEAGIVVAGLGTDEHAYVISDDSLRGTPAEWAGAGVTAYHTWKADRVVAEVNNGGEMVEHTLRTVDATVSYRAVRASRGKQPRAEPISALYEQGKVHHVGMFAELEDQMCEWVPGETSPDRMDALVWGLTELMLDRHYGVAGAWEN